MPASEEIKCVTLGNCPLFLFVGPDSNVVGLDLIGCTRHRRSHIHIKHFPSEEHHQKKPIVKHFVNVPCSYWLHQTQLNTVVLVLIGCTRLSRSHFQTKTLLNSAGAHCNLVPPDVSAFQCTIPYLTNRSTLYKFKQFCLLPLNYKNSCSYITYKFTKLLQ